MALDLVILDPQGSPVHVVALSPDVHARLLSAAAPDSALLARMAEYYGDTAYVPAELQCLQSELSALRRATSQDAELSDVCERTSELVGRAETIGASLVVIAD